MPRALILGLGGGFGSAVAGALHARGWELSALVRDASRLPPGLPAARLFVGDARRRDDLQRAAEGAEVLVHAANPAKYRWRGVALPMLENVAAVAESERLTVLFPGNVYVFDPADGPVFDESSPQRPITEKGRLRLAMEARLAQAAERGARVILLRMGDFIGRHAAGSWLQHLIRRVPRGIRLTLPGTSELPHTWAYLPDAAACAAALLEVRGELPAWYSLHYRGHRASFAEIATALHTAGGLEVIPHPMAWWPLRLAAPFSPLMRGVIEMRYLWQREVNLDDGRLRSIVGDRCPRTPLDEVMREMLQGPVPAD